MAGFSKETLPKISPSCRMNQKCSKFFPEPKMRQVVGKNVKVSLPKSYHSADASKGNILVFKGVSTNVTIDDFKELPEFNKITHAKAERSSRDLPFIKIKCDDRKQAETLISGDLYARKHV